MRPMSPIPSRLRFPRRLTGYEGIAVAVLARAVMDARSHNGHHDAACYFLRCGGCQDLLQNLLLALGLQNEFSADELLERLWRT